MPVTINGSGVVTGLDSEGSSDLGSKLEAAGGLVMVTPSTIANSGGTATLTNGAVSFTGVSSVSLNGVFTSAYENYRVVVSITGSSADDYQFLRWRASGSDATGANYSWQTLYADGTGSAAGRTVSQTGTQYAYHDATDAGTYAILDVFRPNIAANTFFISNSNYRQNSATAIAGFMYWQIHNQATAYDGLTLYPASGTITGTIRVYGYRNGI